MRKIAIVLLLLAVACGSSNNTKGNVTQPEVKIVQTSAIPPAARHVEGGVSVRYRVRVANRASEEITLTRVNLQSMGMGAYSVSSSHPFSVVIAPDHYQDVEFWTAAQTEGSIVGANGPVTLRVVAVFNSPNGTFENTTVQTVNPQGTVVGETAKD